MASVTRIVTDLLTTVTVGVPVMTPDELIVSPVGSPPFVMDQVYAPVPPVAASVVVG